MKKKRIGLWLNVVTIVMCVCAIAIGVYLAKTASLSINGSIGFDAHNVKASVSLYVKGDSLDASDSPSATGTHSRSEYGATALNSAEIDATGTGVNPSLAWDNKLYFYDLGTSGAPETIYFKLAITNKSDYPILAKVNLADSISATDNANIIIDSSKDYSAIILAKSGESSASGFIEFAISIKPDSTGEYPEISSVNLNLKVDLAKTSLSVDTEVRADVAIKEFDDNYKSTVRSSLLSGITDANILSYAERYPYYIEMGNLTGSTEKVKWLIVGTMGTDGLKALTDNDRVALSEGLMLNTTYSMLSEKILYTESTSNYGISFQNQYNSSTNKCTKTGYTDINPNDYAASNIRQYLLGNEVNRSSKEVTSGTGGYTYSGYDADGAEVNLYTTYNLTTDPVFNKIKGRSLTSLYNEKADSSNALGEMAIVPTFKQTDDYTPIDFTGDTEDKLWLLGQMEMETIFVNDKMNGIYYSAQSYIYKTESTTGDWGLRSTSYSYSYEFRHVHYNGQLYGRNAYQVVGTRPAFLI